MNGNGLLKIAQKFRMWIYIVGIGALIIASITKCVHAEEKIIDDYDAFCPRQKNTMRLL